MFKYEVFSLNSLGCYSIQYMTFGFAQVGQTMPDLFVVALQGGIYSPFSAFKWPYPYPKPFFSAATLKNT